MNNHLLSSSEFARVIKSFDDNNIKLKFENFEDLQTCFDENMQIMYESYCRNYVKTKYRGILYEHDLKVNKIVTYMKYFNYYDIPFLSQKTSEFIMEVTSSMRMENIHEIRSPNWGGIRHLTDNIALVCDTNHTVTGYYLTVSCDMKVLSELQVDVFKFNNVLPEPDIHKLIRHSSQLYNLYAIGYTASKNILKIQVTVDPKCFNEPKIKKYYENYVGFYKLINKLIDDGVEVLDLQLEPSNPNYIAVDIFPQATIDEATRFTENLVEMKFITPESKNYILNNKKTNDSKVEYYISKFRWNRSDSFGVKWYNYHPRSGA